MRNGFTATLASLVVLRAAAGPALSVTLHPSSDSPAVTSVLTNTGSEPLKLLKDPRTVLSDAKTESFTITSANGSPDFTGIRVKYSPDYAIKKNDPASFMVLEPGQSREIVHNLAGTYNFARTGAGEYKITALDTFSYVDNSGKVAFLKATAGSSAFKLTKSLVPVRTSRTRSRIFRYRQIGPTFDNCDSEQQANIDEAIPAAELYIDGALASLDSGSSGSERYISWFGEYDSSRSGAVRGHFDKIWGKSTNTNYNCQCESVPEGTFAYVYPDQPGQVYLCDAFWNAPLTGTDSKAGTLVHEQTHFIENGGTQDYAYGQEKCRELAGTDPGTAIQNADSHEYFAENNPFQL
ncbi:unnamed protein product [Rhizoctonia solani]|uniref:Lysine-specific metallo-endopeptidase domain-containing protein n=1 Tax=Rhizoctonia solani TaxID=456999 RepID=A0A8H3GJS8_9AGAM|nr:unnamed protein product [Rhizoctonia solani]